MELNTASQPVSGKTWSDICVLVTGACGSIGSELVRTLLEDIGVGELIGIDNNESELFFLEQRFSSYGNSSFFLADIRDGQGLAVLFRGVDIVFHVAAFKHVVLCERSPQEAIQTNILGTQNVIRAANQANVRRVIYTSSDKAVNPTNVMGTSKLMGERLMTAANDAFGDQGPIYSSVRFGNVLGSRGSVLPIFREQIKAGKPITLTDPDMTRFVMSIQSASNLVIDSASLCLGGEVLITKMPAIRIVYLAEVMLDVLAPFYGHDPSDLGIKIIGCKPGEKMFEELMTTEEVRRTLELERYFVVVPPNRESEAFLPNSYPGVVSRNVDRPYVSSEGEILDKGSLCDLLQSNNLFDPEIDTIYQPDRRYWPDRPAKKKG